jgi:hypothetical protein
MKASGLYSILFLLIIASGCIDAIDVDTATEPTRLVVDGYITSEPKVHQIRLINTVKFSNEVNTPVRNAIVEVIGTDGETVAFTEGEPGYYFSDCCFGAKPGVGYKIRIVYEGKTVESTEQVLPQMIPIKEVNYRPELKKVFRAIDNSVVEEAGIWITTPIAAVEQDKDYYFWQAVPTYVWEATRTNNPEIQICWIRSETRFQDIYIQEEVDGGYTKDLMWIPATRDMQIRYALELNQFNISRETYDFWNRIKKQKENVGSIFDTPPSSIEGNLANVNNSKDIVLGYFGVYSVSTERVYLDLTDLPWEFDLVDVCAALFRGRPPECRNCLENNAGEATNIKPEWWEDK